MNVLSLFTGIGAHDLGLQWAGMKIVGQCEKDTYCLNVLRRHWPSVPRWRDVKDVNRSSVIERCGGLPDLITGGFPCQQCSGLNNVDRCGIGTEDKPTDRSGLVWQMLRIVEETKPRWVLFENVSRLRVAGADDILLSLERAGYSCWPVVVGAAHVGAPHRRMRVWIAGCRLGDVDISDGLVGRAMADANRQAQFEDERGPREGATGSDSPLADPDRIAIERGQEGGPSTRASALADARLSSDRTGREARMESTPATCNSEGRALADSNSSWVPDGELGGQVRRDADCRGSQRWPAPPGVPQYEWEAAQSTPDAERRLGRPVDGYANRLALAALGNSNPPQVVCAIGRAIRRIDAELEGKLGHHLGSGFKK